MEVNRWEHHCVGRASLESLWTRNQRSPALRYLEAEYYAVGDGASRALGMQTAAKALGRTVGDLSVEMATDSSGAKSFPSRYSLGRLRDSGGRWEVPYDEDCRLSESSGHLDEVQGLVILRGTAAEVNVLVMTQGREEESVWSPGQTRLMQSRRSAEWPAGH